MSVWVDVVARARGLSTRVLSDRQLGELARSRDLSELIDRLTSLDVLSAGSAAEPRAIELPHIDARSYRRLLVAVRPEAGWEGRAQVCPVRAGGARGGCALLQGVWSQVGGGGGWQAVLSAGGPPCRARPGPVSPRLPHVPLQNPRSSCQSTA